MNVFFILLKFEKHEPHIMSLKSTAVTCKRNSWPSVNINQNDLILQSIPIFIKWSHTMIPRVILNNIQYVKKLIMVSFFFFALEHFPLKLEDILHKNRSLREEYISHSEPEHLILLWTEYQILGKDIYERIFKKITDKDCPVRYARL